MPDTPATTPECKLGASAVAIRSFGHLAAFDPDFIESRVIRAASLWWLNPLTETTH